MLDEAGMVDADGDGWRDLPGGAPFRLVIDVTGWAGWTSAVASTESYAGDLNDVGINTLINNVMGQPNIWSRYAQGLFVLRDCHASDLDVWSAPFWIFPVGSSPIWPLQSLWYTTGGAQGNEPAGAAKSLLEIYAVGMAEPEVDKRHQYVWDAIRIHIEEGPFFIGASGDQRMPVVIADNFHGVPDLIVLGPWAPSSPGNLHPEQFWIEP